MKRLNHRTESELYFAGKLGKDYLLKYHGANIPFDTHVPQPDQCQYDFGPDAKHDLPPIRQMIHNLTHDVVGHLDNDARKVSPEEYARRRRICETCDYMINSGVHKDRCSLCGCWMKVKAEWEIAVCRANKW